VSTRKEREALIELLRGFLATGRGFSTVNTALYALQLDHDDPDRIRTLQDSVTQIHEIHRELMGCVERALKTLESSNE
jgi:hypothetical protein